MGMIKGLMKGGLLIGALILFRQFINSPYFKQLISLIKETIIPALERMIEKLKPPIMEFINYLGKVLPGVFNAIFGEGGLFDNAVSYFEGVMELIKGIFTASDLFLQIKQNLLLFSKKISVQDFLCFFSNKSTFFSM